MSPARSSHISSNSPSGQARLDNAKLGNITDKEIIEVAWSMFEKFQIKLYAVILDISDNSGTFGFCRLTLAPAATSFITPSLYPTELTSRSGGIHT